jgi:hypothetical protein
MKKRFAMGFSIGLFIFIMINLLAAHLASDCGLLTVFGRDSPWHRPPLRNVPERSEWEGRCARMTLSALAGRCNFMI